jgi:hypothetical protein
VPSAMPTNGDTTTHRSGSGDPVGGNDRHSGYSRLGYHALLDDSMIPSRGVSAGRISWSLSLC